MWTRRALGLVGAAGLAGLGLGFAPSWLAGSPREVYANISLVLTPPAGCADPLEEGASASLAWRNGEPLPPGWAVSDWREVVGTLTGARDLLAGTVELVVTVEDDADELVAAELWLDGAPIASASRSGETVVDLPDRARATLRAWIPAHGAHEYRLRWWDVEGAWREETAAFD